MQLDTAMENLKVLVQGDGADLDLVRFDDTSSTMYLRLVLGDATCADCVMPVDVLENIALDVVRRSEPAVAEVRIDDPREEG